MSANLSSQEEELPNTLSPKSQQKQSQPQQNTTTVVPKLPWGRLIACKRFLQSLDLIEPLTFGRSIDCDILVTASGCPNDLLNNISKRHFKIEKNNEDNLVYITDLSKNGTFVNHEKIGRQNKKILKDNDEIAVSLPQNIMYKVMISSHGGDKSDFLPSQLLSKYANICCLGRGSCGEVRLVKDRNTLKEYAIKKIILSDNNTSQIQKINHPTKVKNEIAILAGLSHPLIIRMFDIISLEKEVYLVLEYMAGGELSKRIPLMSQDIAKFYFMQMVFAINYLHCHNIIHRDLKPENILLLDNKEETLLKITDFGLSKITDDPVTTMCGTIRFVAPEVINISFRDFREYGKSADIWSLGVILYFMISKEFPFQGDDNSQIARNIIAGNYNFSNPVWQKNGDLKNLLKKMLQGIPKKRISILQIFEHKWLKHDHGVKLRVTKLLEQEGLENPMQELSLEPEPKKFKFNKDIYSTSSSSDESNSTLTNVIGNYNCSPTLCF